MHYVLQAETEKYPFDDTISQNRTVSLDLGTLLPGVAYAIQTMKIGEQAEFIISHELAFGDNCYSEREYLPQQGEDSKFV